MMVVQNTQGKLNKQFIFSRLFQWNTSRKCSFHIHNFHNNVTFASIFYIILQQRQQSEAVKSSITLYVFFATAKSYVDIVENYMFTLRSIFLYCYQSRIIQPLSTKIYNRWLAFHMHFRSDNFFCWNGWFDSSLL